MLSAKIEYEKFCEDELILRNTFFEIEENSPKKYFCRTCNHSFSNFSEWQNHKKIHSKKYICEYCGKSYQYFNSLKTHLTLHPNIPKIKCEWCPITFYDKWSFQSHMKKHKFYQCTPCRRKFIWKTKFQKHNCSFQIFNGIKFYFSKVKDETVWTCIFCTKTFPNVYRSYDHALKHVF